MSFKLCRIYEIVPFNFKKTISSILFFFLFVFMLFADSPRSKYPLLSYLGTWKIVSYFNDSSYYSISIPDSEAKANISTIIKYPTSDSLEVNGIKYRIYYSSDEQYMSPDDWWMAGKGDSSFAQLKIPTAKYIRYINFYVEDPNRNDSKVLDSLTVLGGVIALVPDGKMIIFYKSRCFVAVRQ